MPIIADEVNEDWIEKKVRCIIRRDQKRNHGGLINPEFIMCGLKDCPFCLSQERPKEEPREKVTVNEIKELLYELENLTPHCLNYWESKGRQRIYSEINRKLEYLVSLQEK